MTFKGKTQILWTLYIATMLFLLIKFPIIVYLLFIFISIIAFMAYSSKIEDMDE